MSKFKTCGVMLDVSRNGVLRVSAVKEWIDYLQKFGFNMLMLYTEDTYQLEGVPMFGHLRGAYSLEELRAIDDYGFARGVEVVPCIQTLGHMEQYLQYAEAGEVADTSKVLLCGEPVTYELIEKMISAMRSAFRSKRIHIGMDESLDVGTGRYFQKHGFVDRFQILNDHLSKVKDICTKYDFTPMMWDDMFYALGSKTHNYYDTEAKVPQEVIDKLPEVEMVFWDYYHGDPAYFKKMFAGHKRMNRPLWFANGAWTWIGFCANYKLTDAFFAPSLKEAADSGIENVFTTLWNDDGSETNHFFALASLAVMSEINRTGAAPSKEKVQELLMQVTGMDYRALRLTDIFHCPTEDTMHIGKRLIWGDILLNTAGLSAPEFTPLLLDGAQQMQQYADTDGRWSLLYRFTQQLLKTAADKNDLLAHLRDAYIAGDKAYMSQAKNMQLPRLKEDYQLLMQLHQQQWMHDYKPFGWQVLSSRYGAQLVRIDYAVECIENWLENGTAIEELDVQPVLLPRDRFLSARMLIAISMIN